MSRLTDLEVRELADGARAGSGHWSLDPAALAALAVELLERIAEERRARVEPFDLLRPIEDVAAEHIVARRHEQAARLEAERYAA